MGSGRIGMSVRCSCRSALVFCLKDSHAAGDQVADVPFLGSDRLVFLVSGVWDTLPIRIEEPASSEYILLWPRNNNAHSVFGSSRFAQYTAAAKWRLIHYSARRRRVIAAVFSVEHLLGSQRVFPEKVLGIP